MKLILGALIALLNSSCGMDSSLANEALIRQQRQCDSANMGSELIRNSDNNVPIAIRCVPRKDNP